MLFYRRVHIFIIFIIIIVIVVVVCDESFQIVWAMKKRKEREKANHQQLIYTAELDLPKQFFLCLYFSEYKVF